MTGTLQALTLATLAFLAIHILPSSFLRSALVNKVGEKAYLGLFSLASALILFWMVQAYIASPEGPLLWQFENGARYTAIVLMVVASILFFSSFTVKNPTSIGAEGAVTSEKARSGIMSVTRHPMMWSFVLWAIAHLLNNGDLKSVIFFGGFGLLALIGTFMIDQKRSKALGADWVSFRQDTSNIPFAAILTGRAKLSIGQLWWRVLAGLVLFMGLFHMHAMIIGVPPYPL
ncbi:NnrU family protein [Sneathiella limimaris]|uniref:NnrU family protein n=1 Tax=Sneathiella limimaris TaxID=1964213 RepID=UPI00146B6D81|nr:NnrU family protein [Sneathiella limimaris]